MNADIQMVVTPLGMLTLLGLPVADDMDGVPALALLAPRRGALLPPVQTYDTEAWREIHSSRAGEIPAADTRIDQLRALGYLEPESPREAR